MKALLAKYKISFKTAAAAWVVATGTFYGNPAFHQFVMDAYSHVPTGVKAFAVGIGPLVVALYKARKELAPAAPPSAPPATPATPAPAEPLTK